MCTVIQKLIIRIYGLKLSSNSSVALRSVTVLKIIHYGEVNDDLATVTKVALGALVASTHALMGGVAWSQTLHVMRLWVGSLGLNSSSDAFMGRLAWSEILQVVRS